MSLKFDSQGDGQKEMNLGRDLWRFRGLIGIFKIIPDSFSCRSDARSESDPSDTV